MAKTWRVASRWRFSAAVLVPAVLALLVTAGARRRLSLLGEQRRRPAFARATVAACRACHQARACPHSPRSAEHLDLGRRCRQDRDQLRHGVGRRQSRHLDVRLLRARPRLHPRWRRERRSTRWHTARRQRPKATTRSRASSRDMSRRSAPRSSPARSTPTTRAPATIRLSSMSRRSAASRPSSASCRSSRTPATIAQTPGDGIPPHQHRRVSIPAMPSASPTNTCSRARTSPRWSRRLPDKVVVSHPQRGRPRRRLLRLDTGPARPAAGQPDGTGRRRRVRRRPRSSS